MGKGRILMSKPVYSYGWKMKKFQELLLRLSELGTKHCLCGNACSPGFKMLILKMLVKGAGLWHRLQLQLSFDLWPGNFRMPHVRPYKGHAPTKTHSCSSSHPYYFHPPKTCTYTHTRARAHTRAHRGNRFSFIVNVILLGVALGIIINILIFNSLVWIAISLISKV